MHERSSPPSNPPTYLALGSVALETRVIGPLVATKAPAEYNSAIIDAVGGSGWFLALGGAAGGARAAVPCAITNDAASLFLSRIADECGVELMPIVGRSAPARFVLGPFREAEEHTRIAVPDHECPVPHESGAFDIIGLGFVTPDVARELIEQLLRREHTPFLFFSPSGSIFRYDAVTLASIARLAKFVSLNDGEFERLERDTALNTALQSASAERGARLIVTNGPKPVRMFIADAGGWGLLDAVNAPDTPAHADEIGCGDMVAAILATQMWRGASWEFALTHTQAAMGFALGARNPIAKLSGIRDYLGESANSANN